MLSNEVQEVPQSSAEVLRNHRQCEDCPCFPLLGIIVLPTDCSQLPPCHGVEIL